MPGDSATQKKKRPMGLKARAAASSKKQKAGGEELTENGAQVVNDFDDENTATIMLKNDLEDANEMDELEGIFDSALEELSGGDSERAVTLLRGTIHECDRILRVHDRDVEAGVEAVEIEPRFYYIYGTALYSMSDLCATELAEQRWGYLELARHRLEQAKEAMAGQEPFAWRVYENLAKLALDLLAHEQEGKEEDDDEVSEPKLAAALSDLDSALDALVATNDAQQARLGALAMVELAQGLADSWQLGKAGSVALMDWSEAKLTTLTISDEDKAEVCYLRARSRWIRAGVFLSQQDEETGEVPEKDTFQQLLVEANELLAGAESREAVLLRGEVQLNLGNVHEGDKQERLYKLAVEDFKSVQAYGELPEELAQFIEDFENEEDDDDSDDDDE
ncbi:hypothetical protein GGI20_002300 [Coemansia sp. BCRC 34301]|nr:hypothetical protein GGI20_002300 [Coemansia sp. BCRC 34301]